LQNKALNTVPRQKNSGSQGVIYGLENVAIVTMHDKNDQKIYILKCSKPEIKAREIYDALGNKYQPCN